MRTNQEQKIIYTLCGTALYLTTVFGMHYKDILSLLPVRQRMVAPAPSAPSPYPTRLVGESTLEQLATPSPTPSPTPTPNPHFKYEEQQLRYCRK